MLLNKPRAYEVMDKYGLDALIASTRINVYYLVADEKATEHQPRGLGLGQAIGDFSEFGVLPRREDVPATYVLTGPEITRLAHADVDAERDWRLLPPAPWLAEFRSDHRGAALSRLRHLAATG
jgi:hypothetical protein